MLNSKQGPELLEKREGASAAPGALIRPPSFGRRGQKGGGGETISKMKTHREGLNLLLITKVKGRTGGIPSNTPL